MNPVNVCTHVIERLKDQAGKDAAFRELLMESLQKARTTAQTNLNQALFAALSWPEDLDEYVDYLGGFATWTPQQTAEPAWSDPNGPGYQEVYDRLCHFYYLIDQPVGPDQQQIVQYVDWFSDWLVEYATVWGSYLDTTESFSAETLDSFIQNAPLYAVQDSMIDGRPNAPSGWLTFNQFFARELNPGLRPIVSPAENALVASPADCTYKAQYDINPDSSIPGITMKGTHTFANVKDLLEGSPYADAFAGGKFVHYFLGPYSYHRFHAPVSGKVLECRAIQGRVVLNVDIDGNQFDAGDSSEGGYEFTQARGVIVLDTKDSPYGNVGLVAVIPVGMAQVSSVNMTATPNADLLKGDEFGYFLFGGSDIIVLFQARASAQIDAGGGYRKYGTKIATVQTN